MSVRVMALVWDADIEQQLKFVLLCYADRADDDGENLYPSIGYIAYKTNLSERTVQRATKRLLQMGILSVQGVSRFGTRQLKINLDRLPERAGWAMRRPGRPEKLGDILPPPQDETEITGDKTSPPQDEIETTGDNSIKGVTDTTKRGDISTKGVTTTAEMGDMMTPDPSYPSSLDPSESSSSTQNFDIFDELLEKHRTFGGGKQALLKSVLKELKSQNKRTRIDSARLDDAIYAWRWIGLVKRWNPKNISPIVDLYQYKALEDRFLEFLDDNPDIFKRLYRDRDFREFCDRNVNNFTERLWGYIGIFEAAKEIRLAERMAELA